MKTIRKGIALLIKITMPALLGAVLIPALYFAWQMGKPFSQPEFKGLTYYQYMEWRRMAAEDAIAGYMEAHPRYQYAGIGTPMTACYSMDVIGGYFFLPAQAFFYTIAALTGTKPFEQHPLPVDVTLLNFVPKWWNTYEYLFWYNQIHLDSFGSMSPMCRLHPDIPTPD
jgi:hypothetical protein